MSINTAEFVGDSDLQYRVQVAIASKAYGFSETEPENNRRDAKRRQLASYILADTRARVDSFTWSIVSSLPEDFSGSVNDVTDQQIVDGIDSSWDLIAGVSGGDETAPNAPVVGQSPIAQPLQSLLQEINDLKTRLDAANL